MRSVGGKSPIVDTRTKIIRADQACALASGNRPLVLVTGHFDVLQAADVRDLRSVRDRFPGAILLVALVFPPEPLLATRACAELAAALAMVDYVVSLDGEQLAALMAALPSACVVRLEPAQQQRMRELTQHVRRRQSL